MLALALCLGATACGTKKADEIQLTVAQIIDANSTERLLSQYTSVHEIYADVQRTDERYFEAGIRHIKYGGYDYEEMQTPDNAYVYDKGTYHGLITPGGVWNATAANYTHVGVEPLSTLSEEIDKVEVSGDKLLVQSTLPPDRFAVATAEYAAENRYVAGDFFTCAYTLDKNTLAILDTVTTLHHKDGTSKEESHVTITYNTPRPKTLDTMLERLSDTANLRTVSLVASPGTPEELIGISEVPKGETVVVTFYDEEGWNIYSDPECTILHEGTADPNKDSDFYCKKD